MLVKRSLLLSAALALSLSLSACAIIRPYKAPVQQGIQLTAQQIQTLQPGMTQQQVRFILGEPNLNDPFHPQDWIYVYSLKEANLATTKNYLLVKFSKQGKLNEIVGNYTPPQQLRYKSLEPTVLKTAS